MNAAQDRAEDRNTALLGVRYVADFIDVALGVVRILEGNQGPDSFALHLNFREAESLTALAYFAGREDVARCFLHMWAEGDADAADYEEELERWGIYLTSPPPPPGSYQPRWWIDQDWERWGDR